MKRSPMKATRRPIRARSDKAVARGEARRACVAAVIARDRVCQFPALLAAYEAENGETTIGRDARRCRGPYTAHEPRHRRNVDPTDPGTAICVCSWHNEFCETLGALGYGIGVIQRGNGELYQKRR